MQISSAWFSDGAEMPLECTRDGENLSPPLAWRDAPRETRSFALVCADPDAAEHPCHHWAVYDIPREQAALCEGLPQVNAVRGVRQAMNDLGHLGYGGPCLGAARSAHHYHFRLFALQVERLPLSREPSCRDVERAARRLAIAEAEVIGVHGGRNHPNAADPAIAEGGLRRPASVRQGAAGSEN
ncbi:MULTISPECIES: YbhB/YbcL family Raf kinase inhibitor-like protein [unclassified Inquilinus]|uniref:YbhB/YbcL family Raf kinase inhibitor-like protein n=1 Tax=unclassified Inquilinus TaxID=2645927 RepID=UPI003F8DD81D